MKTQRWENKTTTRLFREGLWTLVSLLVLAAVAFGQGILKNGGVFRNTGTSTYKEVQNYRTTNGTIINSGTLNTTTAGGGSGNFLNTNGTTRTGTVRNYIGGINSGLIVVANNIVNSISGSSIDNDSTLGFSTIKVAGSITNTAGTFTTTRGRVWYNGGAQAVLNTTYGTLVTDQTGAKTLASGTAVVNDSLRIDNSSTLTVSTFQLDILAAATATQNSGSLSANAGTVRYAGDRNQTIVPVQYKTLTLTGSTSAHTKTSAGGLSFAASGALTVDTNDTLYVSSGNLDLNTNTPTLTNNSAIKAAANATFHGGITNAGTFYYAGTSTQIIGATTYSTLRVGASGAKTLPSGTVSVTGNYIIDVGTGSRDYITNSNTFQFAGTSPQTLSGLTAENFNILQFSGAGTKSIGAGTISANSVSVAASTGTVTNGATSFTINTGGLAINTGSDWVNNAGMTITAGGLTNSSLFTQSTGTLLISAGGVTNNSTATFAISSGAAMNATGDVTNDGIFINDGTVTVN